MDKFIPLMRPSIDERAIEAVSEVLRSGMLVQGEKVELLEKKIAAYTNSTHGIAVSNGTATLQLALIALGIGPGDEVIIPAFSYIATANVIELVGAKPVFVDIDPDTFNIQTHSLDQYKTSRTKAIMPVHEFGLAANIAEISRWCKKNSIYLIEDAACALGAREHGQHVGTFGEFGSFSFHPRKAVTSGEGGMLICKDAKYTEKLRALRNHGIVMKDGAMDFQYAGFNYRMTDFQAAMVNSQMENFDSILQKRNRLSEIYLSSIKSKKVKLPVIPAGKNHTWQTFHLVVDEGLSRDELIKKLKEKGVGSNYGAQCMPHMTYYQAKYQYDSAKLFPNAYRAYKSGIAIPLYDRMTEEEAVYVASVINEILN